MFNPVCRNEKYPNVTSITGETPAKQTFSCSEMLSGGGGSHEAVVQEGRSWASPNYTKTVRQVVRRFDPKRDVRGDEVRGKTASAAVCKTRWRLGHTSASCRQHEISHRSEKCAHTRCCTRASSHKLQRNIFTIFVLKFSLCFHQTEPKPARRSLWSAHKQTSFISVLLFCVEILRVDQDNIIALFKEIFVTIELWLQLRGTTDTSRAESGVQTSRRRVLVAEKRNAVAEASSLLSSARSQTQWLWGQIWPLANLRNSHQHITRMKSEKGEVERRLPKQFWGLRRAWEPPPTHRGLLIGDFKSFL